MNKKQFEDVCEFFNNLKILWGPDFVNATLSRHKVLNRCLQEWAREYIVDLESNLQAKE